MSAHVHKKTYIAKTFPGSPEINQTLCVMFPNKYHLEITAMLLSLSHVLDICLSALAIYNKDMCNESTSVCHMPRPARHQHPVAPRPARHQYPVGLLFSEVSHKPVQDRYLIQTHPSLNMELSTSASAYIQPTQPLLKL